MVRRDVDPRFGERMRELKAQRGTSYSALAARTYLSTSALHRLAHGQTAPAADVARLIDEALDAGGELAALVFDAPALPQDPIDDLAWLRQGLHDAVSGAGMSAAELDDWELTTDLYGRATRYRPAPVLREELVADFAELRRALERRQGASASRRLTRVTAQLAGLMFLTLIKLNEPMSARRWARTARVAADECGDAATQSWVWAQEGYVHFYAGNLAEALAVASRAQAIAGEVRCAGAPLAAALEGRALGVMGHGRDARAALDRARVKLSTLDAEQLAPSAFGYNEAQLQFHTGNALTHLGAADDAMAATSAALALYPDADYLDRALVRLDRAVCQVRQGEIEAGMAEATDTLTSLTADQRAGMIVQRGQQILASLSQPQKALPAARDFRDALVD